MARDELALYLTLSPEFGGTRFGPFEGLEVRLGADNERCHIVLPEAFGVAREHCKIIRQGDGGMILAASERTAAVFVWKGDARRAAQIQSPTAVRPGDSFALVSPDGARFAIELAPLPAEILAKRSKAKGRRNNLSAEGFAKEGWRLLIGRVWSMGPFGLLMRGWYMVTSGAILQPRIIIPLAIAAVGYMGAFGSSCAAMKFKSDAVKADDALKECEQRAGTGGGGAGGLATRTPGELIAQVAGSTSLAAVLENQTALEAKVEQELLDVLANRDQYAWLFNDGNDAASDWIKLRESIGKSDEFDDLTRVLLPFASAVTKRTGEDWNVQLDVTNRRTCLRGPARLTYRQAKSLGIETIQLDAYRGDETVDFTNDDAGRIRLLGASAMAAGLPPLDPAPEIQEAQLASGREFCMYAVGDDDRESLSKVLAALKRHLGKDAAFVPETSKNEAGLARIVKLWSADVPGNIYEGTDSPSLDFSNSMAAPLEENPAKDLIVTRTAEVIARSVGLPCIAALDNPSSVEATFGRKVDPVTCLVLDYKLRHKAK